MSNNLRKLIEYGIMNADRDCLRSRSDDEVKKESREAVHKHCSNLRSCVNKGMSLSDIAEGLNVLNLGPKVEAKDLSIDNINSTEKELLEQFVILEPDSLRSTLEKNIDCCNIRCLQLYIEYYVEETRTTEKVQATLPEGYSEVELEEALNGLDEVKVGDDFNVETAVGTIWMKDGSWLRWEALEDTFDDWDIFRTPAIPKELLEAKGE